MVGKKRLSMGLVLTLFLGLAAIGTTFAYLYSETNILTNAFSVGTLPIEVIENGEDPGNDSKNIPPNGGTAKKEVKIKNEGNLQSYIRVSLIPTLREGTAAQSETKPCNVTYSIGNWIIQCFAYEDPNDRTEITTGFTLVLDLQTKSDWFYHAGTNAYYYKKPVDPEETTSLLLKEVKRVAGDWDLLNVEVMADAIQAEFEGDPADHPVTSQWPVVIGADGTLSAK